MQYDKINTKNTNINTKESRHSDMCPVRQNPIPQKTANDFTCKGYTRVTLLHEMLQQHCMKLIVTHLQLQLVQSCPVIFKDSLNSIVFICQQNAMCNNLSCNHCNTTAHIIHTHETITLTKSRQHNSDFAMLQYQLIQQC